NINQLVYIIYKEFIFINNLKESIYIDRILLPGITECSLEYYCNAIKIEGYEESKEIIFSMSQTQVIKVKRKKSYKNKHKEIENRDKSNNDNIINDYEKNNNLKNTGNLSFLNILVDIKKIKNTFVVKIEYANFLINNTKYKLGIKVDDCTLVFGVNERKELSIGKNEGFYVLYEENKDKNNNECLNGDEDRIIEDNTENYYENNSQISEIEGQVSNMTGIDINSTKRYNKFFIPTKTIGKKYFYLIIKDKRHLFSVNIIIRSKQRTFTIVEESKWPILIKNMMDNEIRFNQHNVKNKHIVAPLSSYYYTFDILDDNLFLDFSIGNKKIKHKANGVKKDGSVKISSVIINNREIIEVMDSKTEIENKRDNILFLGEIIIRRLSISLIDKEKNNDTEFLAAHFKMVKLMCIKKEIENEDSFEVKLSVVGMQIDNQEYASNFPIILHPVNPYLYVNAKKNRDLHFLQCNFEINSFKPLKIKYFVFLVQEFTLMIEEDIAKRILIFFNLDEIEQQIDIYTYLQQMDMEYNNIFINIKTFHIFPVKLRFSFIKSEKKGLVSNVLSLILKNISNLNLRFNTIILIDVDVDMKSLQNIIFTEYKSQLLIQMINIIASLDFLGNIGNLIDSFSLGIHDFFYEPYLGFVSNDPQKITTGILKGSKSFIKNTVAGVNNTMLKMFKSIGSVIQLATFEKTEQRICIPYHNDKYLLINIESDTYNPISDIVDGLTGLIKKPVDGAKKGVKGFFKGIGKGIAGVIAKPIVGIVGFSTKITEAVKDVVEEKIERVEYPRGITCIKIEGKIVTIKNDNNEYGLYDGYDGYDDRRYNNEHKEYNTNNNSNSITNITPNNNSTTYITSNNSTTNSIINKNNNIKEYKLSDTKPPPSPLSLYLSYNTNQSIGYYIFNILKDKEGFTTFNDSDIGILEDQRIQILIVDNKLFLINIYSMGNITDFNITEEGIVIGRHIVL
ncbi:Vacuolar protein sorting-associated protein MRS6, partial [Spraguea lophii 42_110]